MIALQNLSRKMVVISLPHHTVCGEEHCHCTRRKVGVVDHDPKSGLKTVRALNRRLAGSITLMAKGTDGDKLAELPDGIARIPSVLRLERKGELKITRGHEVAAAKKAADNADAKVAAEAAAKASEPTQAEPVKTAAPASSTPPPAAPLTVINDALSARKPPKE